MEAFIPDKLPGDNKEYKCLQLLNGLRALLISDPSPVPDGELATFALALTVDSGSFHDPPKYKGLSYALEDLLRKDKLLTPLVDNLEGVCASGADREKTLFHFMLPEQDLISCLMILKSLLMKREPLQRELLPQMAELRTQTEDCNTMRNMLLASLAADNYPHGQYDWKNLSDLQRQDPENALCTMIEQLRRDNFVANRMHLCLQSRMPLEELEQTIYSLLSVLPVNNSESMHTAERLDYRHAFRAEFHKRVFFVKSENGICRLDLAWLLPSVRQYYRCKPDKFVTSLLDQKGPGSLRVYLQSRDWTEFLTVGIDDDSFDLNCIYSLFKLSLTLTDEGSQHIDEVLAAVFAYIKLIAAAEPALLRRLYGNLQTMAFNNFRFRTQPEALENVTHLVLNSKYFPGKDVLTAGDLWLEYNEQHISEMIGSLNQLDFNLAITTKNVVEENVPMPDTWQKMWDESKPIEGLWLPEPNPYVAEDFRIFWLEQGQPKLSPGPQRLMNTNVCELWHRLDDTFVQPEAIFSLYFVSPHVRQSAKKSAMCSLYANLLGGQLLELLHPAALAGITHSCIPHDKGLELKVRGYNDKLHLAVEAITQAMVNFADNLEECTLYFERGSLHNEFFEELIMPRMQCRDIRKCLIAESRWLYIDKYKSIAGITLVDFKTFVQKFHQELYIHALCEGNYTEESACNVLNGVISRLQCRAIREPLFVEDRVKKMPLGSSYIRCYSLNNQNSNSVVMNYYQIGPNTTCVHAILLLLVRIMRRRASKHRGKRLFTKVRLHHGIVGFSIGGTTLETGEGAMGLESDIELFRMKTKVIVQSLKPKRFLKFRAALVAALLAPDQDLDMTSNRHWDEILHGEYQFDRNQQLADALRTVTKADLTSFLYGMEADNNRKLSIQVIGHIPTANSSANSNSLVFLPRDDVHINAIVDIDAFKSSLYTYPCTTSTPNSRKNLRVARLREALKRTAAQAELSSN
ncbi:nardilysin-like [Drosophila subobscura]|uniref:nardilysin-like n=1 Tax=Drosophila subobscura TaxID=7241 RepID=UPI00155A5146|nr:nardilysin-like [Drosophila subobscura]